MRRRKREEAAMTTRISRRRFLQASAAVGGGVAFEFCVPGAAYAAKAGAAAPPSEVTHWIVIHPDDRVVIRIARSEMGQGSLTGLAQLVAEELECDWHKVSTEFASPNEHIKRKRIWGSMSTGGSQGIRGSQEYVRKAGAGAREMLVSAAATQWNVPAAECTVASGVITHAPSKRKVSFGKVAAQAAKLEVPKEPKVKDPKDWKIAGQSMRRLENPDKVLGKPVFGADVQLPGMLHASIAQCPVFLGKVKAVDSAAAEKMRGVKGVVRHDNFVAVVADNWWRANEALRKVKIEWDAGENAKVSSDTILAMFREGMNEPKPATARKVGDAPAALAGAAKVVEAEYYTPYLNHCTMEPQTATSWFKPDGTLEVWTSTQNGEGSIATAAETAGLPPEKCEVHKMLLGGGVGRRGAQDYVRQSVHIAKQFPGRPVKLMWSREEDMQHGLYRPASLVRMKAGLDANGQVVAIQSKIVCPSILVSIRPEAMKDGIDFTAVRTLSDSPYTIANDLCEYVMRNGHVPVWFWRAPGLQNSFYRECFIDELAHAAGKDPLEFRLAMLKDGDKNKGVLQAAAKAAGWGSPLPRGVGRGIALSDGFGSYTAMVAEASLNEKGAIQVHRIVFAIDSGYVVNPDACVAQAEGNIIFNIGQLYEANTIKDGRVAESNFHDFPLPKMTDTPPRIEVVFASTGGFWGGHGEPGALCVVPSILNAVFAASGRRVRSLPLKDGVVAA
jgi:isoquinoline 1-oxidoreductase beta subunit